MLKHNLTKAQPCSEWASATTLRPWKPLARHCTRLLCSGLGSRHDSTPTASFDARLVDLPAVATDSRRSHAARAGGAACRGSASDEFILPAVPDAARTAVVDRRQLTGKMKSTALEKNTTGSASPRRTIVPSLATASPRQRHAREHVSNVQRGGAMSHGTIDGSRNKPQNSLSQVFTDLLWALAENSAQTDQVKRKMVQRERH